MPSPTCWSIGATICSTRASSMLEGTRQLASSSQLPLPRRARRPAFLRSPLAVAGLVLIAVVGLLALLAPVLPIANPLAQTLSLRLHAPSLGHLLGTDQLGRDIL